MAEKLPVIRAKHLPAGVKVADLTIPAENNNGELEIKAEGNVSPELIRCGYKLKLKLSISRTLNRSPEHRRIETNYKVCWMLQIRKRTLKQSKRRSRMRIKPWKRLRMHQKKKK